jgi:3-phenylpropionate/trans-cinnamate dioxygenase ferredoxin subunit
MPEWTVVCPVDDLDPEDVMRFDHAGRTFAVYRAPDGTPFVTDGLCTHERVHLSDGLVMDHQIECPKHNGRFDIRTGVPLRAPVCVALKTWASRIRDGQIEIEV